jgi:hypothetical protein
MASQSAFNINSCASAKEIMKCLPQVHIPAVYAEEDRAYSYKAISILQALGSITLSGDFAEFGVYKGRCAKLLQNLLRKDRFLHLFDSFEGLPEDWVGTGIGAGHFGLRPEQIPKFTSKQVYTYKGWFKNTVRPFAMSLSQPLSFIHMDADLYSSTMDVLQGLNPHIVPGTIILFDEYLIKKADDEHRALVDWSAAHERNYEYLWRTRSVQVCIRVTA